MDMPTVKAKEMITGSFSMQCPFCPERHFSHLTRKEIDFITENMSPMFIKPVTRECPNTKKTFEIVGIEQEQTMKIVTEKKRVTLKYHRLVMDDGYIFPNAYEIVELLESLDECDGFVTTIVIYNTEIEKKLLELGVTKKNTKGSCYQGINFKSFKEELFQLLGYNG